MQTEQELALAARDLCVSRGGQTVLSNLSFDVRKGEVFVLLGGNGAGKSTTLLTFIGLLQPTSGEALVFGRSALEHPAEVRSQVAYLPENAALYEHLDARQNLRYFLSLANTERSPADIEQALDSVALPAEARQRPMGSYSKGMRQKVSIALALLRGTPVLMLDEPTSGLDPVAIEDFNNLVETLREKGVSVLMVTHDLIGASQVKSRVGLINNGAISTIVDPGEGCSVDLEELRQLFVARRAA